MKRVMIILLVLVLFGCAKRVEQAKTYTATVEEVKKHYSVTPSDSVTAYALEICFEYIDIETWSEWLKNTPAYYKVDVLVRLQDEEKEFTFDEFFGRLGFTNHIDTTKYIKIPWGYLPLHGEDF